MFSLSLASRSCFVILLSRVTVKLSRWTGKSTKYVCHCCGKICAQIIMGHCIERQALTSDLPLFFFFYYFTTFLTVKEIGTNT